MFVICHSLSYHFERAPSQTLNTHTRSPESPLTLTGAEKVCQCAHINYFPAETNIQGKIPKSFCEISLLQSQISFLPLSQTIIINHLLLPGPYFVCPPMLSLLYKLLPYHDVGRNFKERITASNQYLLLYSISGISITFWEQR